MTAPGAARPGEPGWQHHPGGVAQPAVGQPAIPTQQARGAAAPAPAPTLGGAAANPAWSEAQARVAANAYAAQQAAQAAAAAANRQAPANTQGGTATARARVGEQGASAAPQAAAAPATVRPHKIRSGFGAFHVAQLVSWQMAGAAVIAASQQGMVITAIVAGAALLVISPTFIRMRGRWLHQWLTVWLRYRMRRRQLPASGGNRMLGLLTFVEESVVVENLDVDDHPAAVIAHRGGLAAVFELDPADGALLDSTAQELPSPVSLLPATDPKGSPVSVQMLLHLTPAPRAVSGPGVDRSYLELTNGEVPAHRRSWVVVQAVRTADLYSDKDLRPTLTSAIRRVRRQLREKRVGARLLSHDELLSAVGYLARVSGPVDADNVYGTASDRLVAREGWRQWWVGDTPQSCHRIVRWPRLPWQVDSMLRQLTGVSSVVSIAVTRDPARPESEEVAVEVAIRLTAASQTALTAGDRALRESIRRNGGRTQRLDGEQIHGLAATLPLGGFLR